MIENWKEINGYVGYQISDHGRVLSKKKVGREMKYGKCKGYRNVALTQNGRTRTFTVHRLVAAHFIGEGTGPIVRHKDGNIENLHVSNLAWGTYAENTADRELHGTHQWGSRNPNSRERRMVRTINALNKRGLLK